MVAHLEVERRRLIVVPLDLDRVVLAAVGRARIGQVGRRCKQPIERRLGIVQLRLELPQLSAYGPDLGDQALLLIAVGLTDRLRRLVLRCAQLFDARGELPSVLVGGEQFVDRLGHPTPCQANAEGLRVIPESFDIEHLPHTFT
jgi:hypothetical protein